MVREMRENIVLQGTRLAEEREKRSEDSTRRREREKAEERK
jgi:hypothetical protein